MSYPKTNQHRAKWRQRLNTKPRYNKQAWLIHAEMDKQFKEAMIRDKS